MFSEIEQEYRKGLQGGRFFKYYWPRAVWVVSTFLICDFALGLKHWLMYVGVIAILLIYVIMFFLRELRNAERAFKTVREAKGITTKIVAYSKADESMRMKNLLASLAHHHIDTKEDVKVTLEYYQSRLPRATKPNFLEWFLTTVVTLASILVVAYNDEAGSINVREFETSLVIAGYILIPFVIAKIISTIISITHNHLDTSLVEDLAHICVNFDQYQSDLRG